MKIPLKYFADLHDPQVKRTREHLLEEILLMVIAAVLMTAQTPPLDRSVSVHHSELPKTAAIVNPSESAVLQMPNVPMIPENTSVADHPTPTIFFEAYERRHCFGLVGILPLAQAGVSAPSPLARHTFPFCIQGYQRNLRTPVHVLNHTQKSTTGTRALSSAIVCSGLWGKSD